MSEEWSNPTLRRTLSLIETEAGAAMHLRCYAACVAILAAMDPASEAADGARLCVEAVRSLRGAAADSGRPGCGPVASEGADPAGGRTGTPPGPRAEPLAAPRKEPDGYPPVGPRNLP